MNEKEIRDFLQKHKIEIDNEGSFNDGKYIKLKYCPFDNGHKDGDARLLIYADTGMVVFKCHHNSCKGKKLSDFIKHYEPDYYKNNGRGDNSSQKDKPQKKRVPYNLKPVSQIEEKEAEWILPGRIPRGQITTICGDGGIGKSFIWADIIAALSRNELPKSIYPDFPFDENMVSPEDQSRPFLMLSGEDSTAVVIKKRLRKAKANQDRIFSLGAEDERFGELNFHSQELEWLIDELKPLVCVFDPVQSFIPENFKMGERNSMRKCTQDLIRLGEKYDCTFIIVVHSNKRQGAYGRQRMADSSDLWDVSRSVLMGGFADKNGNMYLSHEKSNYGKTEGTILYKITGGGVIENVGTTEKKDRDFVAEQSQLICENRPSPAKDEAIQYIRDIVGDDEMEVNELESNLKNLGATASAIRKAKKAMKDTGELKIYSKGTKGRGKGTKWYAKIIPFDVAIGDTEEDKNE